MPYYVFNLRFCLLAWRKWRNLNKTLPARWTSESVNTSKLRWLYNNVTDRRQLCGVYSSIFYMLDLWLYKRFVVSVRAACRATSLAKRFEYLYLYSCVHQFPLYGKRTTVAARCISESSDCEGHHHCFRKAAGGGSVYVRPTDTWRNNNVIITSKRRRDVVLTQWWRYYCGMCPLGVDGAW